MKRVSADDSADSRVKVGHRQAIIQSQPPSVKTGGGFAFGRTKAAKQKQQNQQMAVNAEGLTGMGAMDAQIPVRCA